MRGWGRFLLLPEVRGPSLGLCVGEDFPGRAQLSVQCVNRERLDVVDVPGSACRASDSISYDEAAHSSSQARLSVVRPPSSLR